MPISTRFVVQTTIGLLAVGFLTLLFIVGMTIWLGERAQAGRLPPNGFPKSGKFG